MKILEIRDNGGETWDRYSVVYDELDSYGPQRLFYGVGMSEHPFHPQGFGQHGTFAPGKHLGKKIKFSQLPPDCQKLVNQDLSEEVSQ